MEFKFNDKPITIKTLEIDGKKLSKQLLQQFKLTDITYFDSENNLHSFNQNYKIESCKGIKLNCKIIGYINLLLDNKDVIEKFYNYPQVFHSNNHYSIILINELGEINRSYMSKYTYSKVFDNTYPQIFI